MATSTVTEKEQDAFLKILKDDGFKEQVKQSQENYLSLLANSPITNNTSVGRYTKWILKQMNDHYILIAGGGMIVLFNKGWTASIVVGLLNAHKDYTKLFTDTDGEMLEISNVHSMQKGEGYKLIRKVIRLSKEMNLPISLWVETAKNKAYFERYGFKTYGKIGVNKEHLMIKR